MMMMLRPPSPHAHAAPTRDVCPRRNILEGEGEGGGRLPQTTGPPLRVPRGRREVTWFPPPRLAGPLHVKSPSLSPPPLFPPTLIEIQLTGGGLGGERDSPPYRSTGSPRRALW